MILKSRALKNPKLTLRIGMLSLVLGSLTQYLGPRTGLLSENWVDGLHGFFLGAAIALMLSSLAVQGRGGDRFGP